MTDAQERGDGALPVAPVTRYAPGPWTLVAGAGIAVLVDVAPSADVVAACWDAIERGSDFDTLLDVIRRDDLRSVPGFVLAVRSAPSGSAVKVLVSGTARAHVVAPGVEPVTLRAAQSPTWLAQDFPAVESIRLVADSADSAGGPDGPDEPDEMLPLMAGVVAAGTVVLTPSAQPPATVDPTGESPVAGSPAADVPGTPEPPARSFDHLFGSTQNPVPVLPLEPEAGPDPVSDPELKAVPESVQQPAPDARPAAVVDVPVHAPSMPGLIESLPWHVDAELVPSQPFPSAPAPLAPAPSPSVAERDIPAPVPAGAPTVRAVLCANRHLSPPDAGSCRVCGARIRPQESFTVPRPALGVLCLSTGEAVPLDRDVLLGRAPSAPPPGARPVRVPSPNNDVSRNHVRISVEDWQVRVTDLGSTNGTVVTLPGQQPIRLRPHAAFTIVPDTVLNVADEVFARFEVPRTLG